VKRSLAWKKFALDKKIQHLSIETKGGKLNVSFKKNKKNSFSEIYLEGQSCLVYKGEIVL